MSQKMDELMKILAPSEGESAVSFADEDVKNSFQIALMSAIDEARSEGAREANAEKMDGAIFHSYVVAGVQGLSSLFYTQYNAEEAARQVAQEAFRIAIECRLVSDRSRQAAEAEEARQKSGA